MAHSMGRFAMLPREIRDIIYGHAIVACASTIDYGEIVLSGRRNCPHITKNRISALPGTAAVCKQIRQEQLDIFHRVAVHKVKILFRPQVWGRMIHGSVRATKLFVILDFTESGWPRDIGTTLKAFIERFFPNVTDVAVGIQDEDASLTSQAFTPPAYIYTSIEDKLQEQTKLMSFSMLNEEERHGGWKVRTNGGWSWQRTKGYLGVFPKAADADWRAYLKMMTADEAVIEHFRRLDAIEDDSGED